MQFLTNLKIKMLRVYIYWKHAGIVIELYTIIFGGTQVYLFYTRLCENSWLSLFHLFTLMVVPLASYYSGKGNLLKHRNKSLEIFQ